MILTKHNQLDEIINKYDYKISLLILDRYKI